MGVLIRAVQQGHALGWPLTFAGVLFVLLQVLKPIHTPVSANLGGRTTARLYDRLLDAWYQPPCMGEREDPALTNDLTVAREFDAGMTGPSLYISMDFIADVFFQAEDGIRDYKVTGVQTCALPI